MAHIDVSHRPLARRAGRDGAAATRREDRERTRANLVLTQGWAALAIIFGAYAIARGSMGAAVFAVALLGALRVAWRAAWRGGPRPHDEERRQIELLP